jgi:hypothetical protein
VYRTTPSTTTALEPIELVSSKSVSGGRLTFVLRCSAVRCPCLCVACAVSSALHLSSPHLPVHRRSPKRSKDSRGYHIPTRHPVIPTEKHKEEQDKRLPKHERATKRVDRGRREYNHPGANPKAVSCVSPCGVLSIVAFGLGVAYSTCAFHLFICSRDSIETDVISIAIAGSGSITRRKVGGIANRGFTGVSALNVEGSG